MNKRNIFVSDNDPTVITDIIDWQSSSIEPAFVYADEIPDFVIPQPNVTPDDQPAHFNAELCRQAFDACLKGLVPKLCAARTLDEDLLRPFRYCHRTWRDGAVAFRQELNEVSKRWKELGLATSCPYSLPTAEESLIHQEDFKSFVKAVQLKQNLVNLLDIAPDGWVQPHLWAETKAAHQEAFHEVLQAVENPESIDEKPMSEEDLRKIWPYDLE